MAMAMAAVMGWEGAGWMGWMGWRSLLPEVRPQALPCAVSGEGAAGGAFRFQPGPLGEALITSHRHRALPALYHLARVHYVSTVASVARPAPSQQTAPLHSHPGRCSPQSHASADDIDSSGR